MILFFDVETNGLILWKEPSDHPGQPRIVSFAAILQNDKRENVMALHSLVKPDGWTISPELTAIHGITTEQAQRDGIPWEHAWRDLAVMLDLAERIVGHNISFDIRMLRIETKRRQIELPDMVSFCTCTASTKLCNLPPTEKMLAARMNKPKAPTLTEAYKHFFDEELQGAHGALADTPAAMRIYYHLKDLEAAV
jgi:DNA polymerase-3 subunit epsilon